MLTFIGFIIVGCIILYKRSTEIITVNPLRGQFQAPLPGDEAEEEEDDEDASDVPDFARLVNTISQAARNPKGFAEGQGRAAVLKLVENNKFIEAMQLYRRLYGVDLQTAKKAVDKMMLER
jgi:hypothetical protein